MESTSGKEELMFKSGDSIKENGHLVAILQELSTLTTTFPYSG